MGDADPWPEWISQHQRQLAERSYGHELRFVELVLRRVPEIDPSWVTHEFPFQDSSGRNRRIDFVLEHWSLHRPIAIEVDGRNKTGSVPSKAEHDDFFERQNALTALDFRLLRYTNAQVAQNPVKLRREISEAIAVEQLAAQRLRATQQAAGTPDVASDPGAGYQAHRPEEHLPGPASDQDSREVGRSDWEPDDAPRLRQPRAKPSSRGKLLAVAIVVAAVAMVGFLGNGNDAESPRATTGEEIGVEPPEAFTCPSSAPVKGNERADDGELIYHVPSGQFYEQTNPVRCFESEADAQRAGFRASQR